jgi:hypothetical protein
MGDESQSGFLAKIGAENVKSAAGLCADLIKIRGW